jgi:hypothetical protein
VPVVHWWSVAALALEVSGIGNTLQGATGVAVVSASVTGSVALGDVVPALGPLGVMSQELPCPS